MTPLPFSSTSHVSDDQCLDLVQRLLDADARRNVLDHLAACAACEARFQDMAASHARAQSAAQSALHVPTLAVPVPLAPRRRPMVWMAAAVLAAAALGVTWFAQRPVTQPDLLAAADSQLPAAQLRGAIRGLASTGADSVVMAGLDAYNRQDLATAKRRLETALATGSMEQVRRVYLGSVLLELGDAAGARTLLRGLRENDVPEPWKSESRWTLAIALARTGDTAAADSLLEVLSRGQGPVAERARAARGAAPPSK